MDIECALLLFFSHTFNHIKGKDGWENLKADWFQISCAVHVCDNAAFVWLSSKWTESKKYPLFNELGLTPQLYNIVVTKVCLEACIMLLWHGVVFLSFCFCDIWFKAVLTNVALKRLNEWCSQSENIIVQSLCLCSSALAYLFITGKWQNQGRIYLAEQTEYILSACFFFFLSLHSINIRFHVFFFQGCESLLSL